ncbi:MAG: hypothetical protein ACP5G1_00110 [Nanopusillaceae archaeon]
MLRQLVYLAVLFIVGYISVYIFYNYFESTGNVLAREVSNFTNSVYVQPFTSYIISSYSSPEYSILYLIGSSQLSNCIKNILVEDLPVNYTVKFLNNYTAEIKVYGREVDKGANLTIQYCDGQKVFYIIS